MGPNLWNARYIKRDTGEEMCVLILYFSQIKNNNFKKL